MRDESVPSTLQNAFLQILTSAIKEKVGVSVQMLITQNIYNHFHTQNTSRQDTTPVRYGLKIEIQKM